MPRIAAGYDLIGYGLIAVGTPLFISPVPVGAVVVAVGASFVIMASRRRRAWLRRTRSRHPWVDRAVESASRAAPKKARAVINETRPNDPAGDVEPHEARARNGGEASDGPDSAEDGDAERGRAARARAE